LCWVPKQSYHPSSGKPVWVRDSSADVTDKISTDKPLGATDELKRPPSKTETNSLTPPLLTPHHIIFDDNIHNDPNDGIVAVRASSKQSKKDSDGKSSMLFAPLNGYETIGMQGIHLVRVPTLEPVLSKSWFLEQIERCEVNKRKHQNELNERG